MISVIVPVYNGSAYIERCINSITGSTFRDIEIIVVENGSTDNTWEVLEALAAGDSRIKPISTEIRGLSNARNIGIDHASGDWIAFVDADDYISPLMYERLAEAAQTHGADLVLCDFAQGTEEHFDFTEANRPAEGCNAAEELTRDDYFRRTYLRAQYKYSVAWNKLFRRETMGNIRFNPSLHYIEDRNFAIQFVLNSKKVVSISETLYYYYRNGNSISNSAGQRQRVGQVYDTLEDIDILERSGEKLLYRDCAYANLLQLADFRLRQAKKYHMDDVQQELRPIIARARKAVIKGELPLKEKLRFLGEHYYYVLRGLRKK